MILKSIQNSLIHISINIQTITYTCDIETVFIQAIKVVLLTFILLPLPEPALSVCCRAAYTNESDMYGTHHISGDHNVNTKTTMCVLLSRYMWNRIIIPR